MFLFSLDYKQYYGFHNYNQWVSSHIVNLPQFIHCLSTALCTGPVTKVGFQSSLTILQAEILGKKFPCWDTFDAKFISQV